MIYLILKGRIGNQLFIYAMAEALREKRNQNERIIIDDSEVSALGWENSLKFYNLPNVEFVHGQHSHRPLLKFIILRGYHFLTRKMNYREKFLFEKKHQKFFNRFGIACCENGFLPLFPRGKNILIEGYFQSEKYFHNVSDRLKIAFSENILKNNSNYPNINLLKNRNSVCISIKVEHNVGSDLYDVCGNGYWDRAIELICEKVENPLFFICSDNMDYVKDNLIDCTKYDVVCQSNEFPVHISLAIMGLCKHFIIGNTTFGWWAQYISSNPTDKKIVIAPSKWMLVDMPIDIYQDNWTLIEV